MIWPVHFPIRLSGFHQELGLVTLLCPSSGTLIQDNPFRSCGAMKLKSVPFPNIPVVPPLPLLVSHIIGADGAVMLYEGEIRDVWINLSIAGTVPVEQAHISLSGKNQDSVVSIASETLKSALPLKPGAEVTIRVTLKLGKLAVQTEASASKSVPGTPWKYARDGTSPMFLIHYAGIAEIISTSLLSKSQLRDFVLSSRLSKSRTNEMDQAPVRLICSKCPRGFGTYDDIKQHIREIHRSKADKKYACPICYRPYPNAATLKLHQQNFSHARDLGGQPQL